MWQAELGLKVALSKATDHGSQNVPSYAEAGSQTTVKSGRPSDDRLPGRRRVQPAPLFGHAMPPMQSYSAHALSRAALRTSPSLIWRQGLYLLLNFTS